MQAVEVEFQPGREGLPDNICAQGVREEPPSMVAVVMMFTNSSEKVMIIVAVVEADVEIMKGTTPYE